jgi:NADPH-dependent curcumin reductase CurA
LRNSQVDQLKNVLGFDDAFNYKEEPDLKSALRRPEPHAAHALLSSEHLPSLTVPCVVPTPCGRYFPDGIDINFENVGGEMLEAALANMNVYGRVALSGVISEYTGSGRPAVPDLVEVIYKRITLRGFFAWDFIAKFDEFNAVIGDWIRQGKVKVLEDVSDGLDSVLSAFAALFRGGNVGKKLVKLV